MRKFVPVILLALTLYSYWGLWKFDYLSYDDPEYVTANPVVQQGLSWTGFRWAFTTNHAANWHPLTWLSHMLDRSLFGPGPAGPHAMNLVLHSLGVLMLWRVLVALPLPTATALVAVGVYACHPTRLESVAWVSERKDVLSALFGWLALWLHLQFAHKGGLRWRWGSVAALGLGLLAKPMLVSWPFLFLCIDFLLLRRPLSARRLWLEKWPHVLLVCAAAGATLWAQSQAGAVRTGAPIEGGARAANALVAFARYPWVQLWPADLSFFYPHPALVPALGGHATWKLLAGALFALAILGSSLRAGRGAWSCGWAWSFVTLLPVLGLLQVGPQAWADRYAAIPAVGISIALCTPLSRLRLPERISRAAAAAVLLVFAVWTHAQRLVWANDFALYSHALTTTEHNWLAHGNLGRSYLAANQSELAQREFEAALRAKPDDAVSHYNLGTLWLLQGDSSGAEGELRAAVSANARHAEAHNNLSRLLARQARFAEALPFAERAAELDPKNPELACNLADVLRRLGQRAAALQRLQALLAERPQFAAAHDMLARIWIGEDPRQAVAHAERSVRFSSAQDPVFLETLAQCQLAAGDSTAAQATARLALPLAEAAAQPERVQRLRALISG